MRFYVEEVKDRKDLIDFVKFPYMLYRRDRFWVPPIFEEQVRWVLYRETPLFKNNPLAFVIARCGDRVVGRGVVVNDLEINSARGRRKAYFTMIESIKNFRVFEGLFEYMEEWAKSKGLYEMEGPVSPTRGDDFRGLLVEGFNSRPVFMETYNPPYYKEFMEKLGYKKHIDLYAYYYDIRKMDFERRIKALEYAKRRYGFRIDRIDVRRIEREARDIKYILDRAMPQWEDLIPPSYEEVLKMAYRLKRYADPDLIYIARTRDGEPIGFNVALPDYNQVLHRFRGRIRLYHIPIFLLERRRIKGARMFVMFVVPEYRKKGVAHGIYLTALLAGRRKGYIYAEGSTIGEENLPMRRDAERLGGIHYRTYRVYKKELR